MSRNESEQAVGSAKPATRRSPAYAVFKEGGLGAGGPPEYRLLSHSVPASSRKEAIKKVDPDAGAGKHSYRVYRADSGSEHERTVAQTTTDNFA